MKNERHPFKRQFNARRPKAGKIPILRVLWFFSMREGVFIPLFLNAWFHQNTELLIV
jgi:hypothetical protein